MIFHLASFPGYATIPTTTNQTLVISQLGLAAVSSQPNILPAHSGKQDMQKVSLLLHNTDQKKNQLASRLQLYWGLPPKHSAKKLQQKMARIMPKNIVRKQKRPNCIIIQHNFHLDWAQALLSMISKSLLTLLNVLSHVLPNFICILTILKGTFKQLCSNT